MSNSSLVSYTKLSPNNSGKRTHAIDTITPHCVVGQVTIERLGDIFASPSRQASSNYGIGVDGRVGLFVDEGSRSWCSSSNANDQRAVTIECASDDYAPYAFNETVYNRLIDLCVDICQRNGKNTLIWIDDKNKALNYNLQSNEMILTVHRWFAAKSCPGDWMYARMGDLANKVTQRLGGTQPQPTPAPTPAPQPSSKIDVFYRVKANGRWLPEVRNLEDYAGIENQAITDIAVQIPNHSVKYRVHILKGGWLPYVTGYNVNDFKNGYAGNGKVIDAIEIQSDVNVRYKVSIVGTTSFYPWQYGNQKGNGQDGYAGAYGKKIDKLYVEVV
jgi:hypothetical protein